MSYRDESRVNFDGIKVACLSGNNGAGKSALLDAMTWAVWGKTRASSDRDIITLGEDRMVVTFEFRIRDREYRVFRRRTRSGRPTLEFDARQVGTDSWGPVSGDSIRETQQRIDDTLKIDYDTFVNSAFLMQGNADSFTRKRPAERKQVLSEILNLRDYDDLLRLARDEERLHRAKIDELQRRIARTDDQLRDRQNLERNLEALEDELKQSVDLNAEIKLELSQVTVQLELYTSVRDTLNKSSERRNELGSRAKTLEGRLIASRSSLSAAQELVSREADIESAFADLNRWREIVTSNAAVLRERKPHEDERNDLLRRVDRLEADLMGQIERETEKKDRLEAEILTLSEFRDELLSLKEASRRDQAAIECAGQFEDERREAESERTRLDTENHRLRTEMHDIRERMKALEAGEASCPICRRPFDEGDHEHISREWESDGKRLGDKYRENKERIASVNARIAELDQQLQCIQNTRAEHQRRAGLIAERERQIGRLPGLQADLEASTAKIKQLEAIRLKGEHLAEATEKLSAVSEALEALPYDADEDRLAHQKIFELSAAKSDYEALLKSRAEYASLSKSIQDTEQQLEQLRQDMKYAEDEIAALQERLADEPRIRNRQEKLTAEVRRLDDETSRLHAEIGATRNRICHLVKLQDERNELITELENQTNDAATLKELIAAFGRNGIPTMVIENILPELEDEANALLRRLSSSYLNVAFQSTREAISNDKTIETLDIMIKDEYGRRPHVMYSGGEAFRINFAIRVALSKLLARRAGATIDMLVVDEGFGTQDTQGRTGLVEALKSVEQDFETILVITHIDEIRDMFPVRIEVVKTPDGSRATVI